MVGRAYSVASVSVCPLSVSVHVQDGISNLRLNFSGRGIRVLDTFLVVISLRQVALKNKKRTLIELSSEALDKQA